MSLAPVLEPVVDLSSPKATGEVTACGFSAATQLIAEDSCDELQEDDKLLHHPLINTPISFDTCNHTKPKPLDLSNWKFTFTQDFLNRETHHLNHSSLFELFKNKSYLSLPSEKKVEILNHKRLQYADKFRYENYFSQCCLLTLLDHDIATNVCLCDVKSSEIHGINPTGLCNRHRLCHHCANRRAIKTLKTFQPKFYQHKWCFLTISYKENLPLTHLSGPQWARHWAAAKLALKRLVSTDHIPGAMWREELAIPSLIPTRVLPHLHAIIPVENISPCGLELLASWIAGYRDDLGYGVELESSIKCDTIATEEDFVRYVSYIHKPVNFVNPYALIWDDDASREDKVNINRLMRDLIEATIMHPKDRDQLGYFGNMLATTRGRFIGVPKNEREGTYKPSELSKRRNAGRYFKRK